MIFPFGLPARLAAAFTLFFACEAQVLLAQGDESGADSSRATGNLWGTGVFAGLQWNQHRAEMRGLPGVPSCCPRYDGGSGMGPVLGGYVLAPVGERWLLSARLSYAEHGGRVTARESKPVFDGVQTIDALVEHEIDSRISSLGLEPLVGFRPYGEFGLFAGFRIAAVVRARFDQVERLVRPEDWGTFENHRRTRNEVKDAEVPDALPLAAALVALAEYRFPLVRGGEWFLVPEISYALALTRVASGVPWFSDGLRAALGVRYVLKEKPAPPPPPPPPPPEPPKPPRLEASLDAYGVDREGRLVESPVVTVEEFESMRVWPLLPYLFFEENSAVIPERYARLEESDAARFTADVLHEGSTFSAYYHVLNVIGLRMREHPNAVLRITGCNSGGENGGEALSRARADAVARYLNAVWGVPRSHLVVEARGLPARPSRTDDPDGMVENRRVEISSNVPEVLDPLVTRSVERRLSTDRVRFVPRAVADAGVREWRLDVVRGGGSPLRTFSGTGVPPPEIDWELPEDVAGTAGQDTLLCILRVVDASGRSAESRRAIGVREITIKRKKELAVEDKVISRFNLILFDYDSPDLGPRNDRVVERFIRPEISERSRIEVVGYTDRMGEAMYNEALSRKRAENTARRLGIPSASVLGKGENDPPYDNDLPEGRFYNRTVEILVETPK
ncbi:MAG: OmpA family protein [Bacteroidota bacterium]|nr:OmpA family protein [Bacteroidota bacterium]